MEGLRIGLIIFGLSWWLWSGNGYRDKRDATHLACGMTIGLMIVGLAMVSLLSQTADNVCIPVLQVGVGTLIFALVLSILVYWKRPKNPERMKISSLIFLALPFTVTALAFIWYEPKTIGLWLGGWTLWLTLFQWTITAGFWNPHHATKSTI